MTITQLQNLQAQVTLLEYQIQEVPVQAAARTAQLQKQIDAVNAQITALQNPPA